VMASDGFAFILSLLPSPYTSSLVNSQSHAEGNFGARDHLLCWNFGYCFASSLLARVFVLFNESILSVLAYSIILLLTLLDTFVDRLLLSSWVVSRILFTSA
jgi:hypothetical protein